MNEKLNHIQAILKSGRFDDLIGILEDDHLDFKGAPYQIDQRNPGSEAEKLELVKDVSSFANTGGGMIIIGVTTKEDDTHEREFADHIKMFPRNDVSLNQYHDILNGWLFPILQGVEINWFPSADDQNKGIIAITIPGRLNSAEWPFLIRRTVDDSGNRRELLFGLCERRRDNSEHFKIEELHARLRDGLRSSSTNQQFDNIQETLQHILSKFSEDRRLAEGTALSELLPQKIRSAMDAVGLNERPAFILSMLPTQKVEIPSLFSGNSEIVRLLENPGRLRDGGFDLRAGDQARIVQGQLRRVVYRMYKTLDLWNDGTLIFIADGGDEFLSWNSRNRNPNSPLRINQLVLIESTYLFCKLAKQILEHFVPRPSRVEFRIGFQNMSVNGQQVGLKPGSLTRGDSISDASESEFYFSQSDSFIFDPIEIPTESDPGEIAFYLVKKVYNWFGIEDQQVPYQKEVESRKEIDPEKIQTAGRNPIY